MKKRMQSSSRMTTLQVKRCTSFYPPSFVHTSPHRLPSFKEVCEEKVDCGEEKPLRMELAVPEYEQQDKDLVPIEKTPWRELVQATETLNDTFVAITGEGGSLSLSGETLGEINSALAKIREQAEKLHVGEKELVTAVRDHEETSATNTVFMANALSRQDIPSYQTVMDLASFYFGDCTRPASKGFDVVRYSFENESRNEINRMASF